MADRAAGSASHSRVRVLRVVRHLAHENGLQPGWERYVAVCRRQLHFGDDDRGIAKAVDLPRDLTLHHVVTTLVNASATRHAPQLLKLLLGKLLLDLRSLEAGAHLHRAMELLLVTVHRASHALLDRDAGEIPLIDRGGWATPRDGGNRRQKKLPLDLD